MSDIYSIYESSLNNLSVNIEKLLKSDSLDAKDLSRLKTDVQECNRIIKQMTLEINSLKSSGQNVPQMIEVNYRKYKEKVENFNNRLLFAQDNVLNNFGSTLDSNEHDLDRKILQEEFIQNQKLNNIQKEAYDIEHTGNNIMINLDMQGEHMKNMKENLNTLDKEAEQSNNLINQLIAQAMKNKRIFYGFIIVLVVIFCLILFL